MVMLLVSLLWARDVKLIFGSDTMEKGQSTELVLEIRDMKINVPPTISADEGLRIQARSQSPSRIFKMINGKSTTILRYKYKVVALEEGDWKIGPTSLRYSGKNYIAASKDVQVVSKSKKSQPSKSFKRCHNTAVNH